MYAVDSSFPFATSVSCLEEHTLSRTEESRKNDCTAKQAEKIQKNQCSRPWSWTTIVICKENSKGTAWFIDCWTKVTVAQVCSTNIGTNYKIKHYEVFSAVSNFLNLITEGQVLEQAIYRTHNKQSIILSSASPCRIVLSVLPRLNDTTRGVLRELMVSRMEMSYSFFGSRELVALVSCYGKLNVKYICYLKLLQAVYNYVCSTSSYGINFDISFSFTYDG